VTTSAELDTWTAALATTLSMHVTRDPDLIHPPCVFVSVPDVVLSPLSGGGVIELPVYVVAEFTGKQAIDAVLDALPAVLAATGQNVAAHTPLTIADTPYTAYLITVPVRLDPPS
jgi:hypothetical protein